MTTPESSDDNPAMFLAIKSPLTAHNSKPDWLQQLASNRRHKSGPSGQVTQTQVTSGVPVFPAFQPRAHTRKPDRLQHVASCTAGQQVTWWHKCCRAALTRHVMLELCATLQVTVPPHGAVAGQAASCRCIDWLASVLCCLKQVQLHMPCHPGHCHHHLSWQVVVTSQSVCQTDWKELR